MYIAIYDTRSYTFTALGKTEAAAIKAMKKTLRVHCRQYDKSMKGFDLDDISVAFCPVGKGMRDYEVLG